MLESDHAAIVGAGGLAPVLVVADSSNASGLSSHDCSTVCYECVRFISSSEGSDETIRER
jgi:hypothetical protein